eukprot:CAMPEP_0119013952 /NCGR_PEP_ID=MMETSP1176-20130426/9278_1 /TAXON_ID=265551 /ORGANISM="Synedropsis recta cf, Strain CCMP1620" /LENGTH=147 /DNA_ID=CAMNT_0006967083 /DNA_START=56 /DNA_END=496 /DNA_ORIENTATION=+
MKLRIIATLLLVNLVAAQDRAREKKAQTCPAVGDEALTRCTDAIPKNVVCGKDRNSGVWSGWSEWARNAQEGRYVARQRACKPSGPCGIRCKGKSSEIAACQNEEMKAIDGHWSEWSDWAATSVWTEWATAAVWTEWTTTAAVWTEW